jgi:hypothetical protein
MCTLLSDCRIQASTPFLASTNKLGKIRVTNIEKMIHTPYIDIHIFLEKIESFPVINIHILILLVERLLIMFVERLVIRTVYMVVPPS